MSRKAIANGDYFAIIERNDYFFMSGKVIAGDGFSILKIQVFKDRGDSIWVSGLPLENLLSVNMEALRVGVKAKMRRFYFKLIFKKPNDLIKFIFEEIK